MTQGHDPFDGVDPNSPSLLDLDELVAAFADEYPPPPPDDELHADRLLRRMARERDHIAQIFDRADLLISHVIEWRDHEARPHQARLEYLEGELERWGKARGKAFSSPFGKITTRKGSTRTEITDEVALRDWLLVNEHLDLLKITPAKGAVGKAFEPNGELDAEAGSTLDLVDPETGELVPGVAAVNNGRTWTVSPAT